MIGKTNRRFWKHFDALPANAFRLKTLGIIAALTISLTNAHARPGETAQEMEARFGKPRLEKQSHGNISREYSYHGYRVSVLFQNGVCRTETYQKVHRRRSSNRRYPLCFGLVRVEASGSRSRA